MEASYEAEKRYPPERRENLRFSAPEPEPDQMPTPPHEPDEEPKPAAEAEPKYPRVAGPGHLARRETSPVPESDVEEDSDHVDGANDPEESDEDDLYETASAAARREAQAAIVKGAVHDMEEEMKFEDEEPQAAVFWVEIPARSESVASQSPAISSYGTRSTTTKSSGSQSSPASTSATSIAHSELTKPRKPYSKPKSQSPSLPLFTHRRPASLQPRSTTIAYITHALEASSSPPTPSAIQAQIKAWKTTITLWSISNVLAKQACFERHKGGWRIKRVWKKSALRGLDSTKGSADETDRLWCTCRRPATDSDTIGCAAPECEVGWYHLSCLAAPPTTFDVPWICPSCIGVDPTLYCLAHALVRLPNERGTFKEVVVASKVESRECVKVLRWHVCFGESGGRWRIVEGSGSMR